MRGGRGGGGEGGGGREARERERERKGERREGEWGWHGRFTDDDDHSSQCRSCRLRGEKCAVFGTRPGSCTGRPIVVPLSSIVTFFPDAAHLDVVPRRCEAFVAPSSRLAPSLFQGGAVSILFEKRGTLDKPLLWRRLKREVAAMRLQEFGHTLVLDASSSHGYNRGRTF